MEKTTKTKEYQTVINHLIEIRKSSHITQTKLAVLIEKPQSFISKYERLERKLDCIEIFEIFNALGIPDKEVAKYLTEVRKSFKNSY